MPNRQGLRRRKPMNSDSERVGKWISKTGKRGKCESFLKAFLLLVVTLTSALFYAYATSPTASTVVKNSHDIAKIKWRYVNNTDLEKGKKILEDLLGPESIVVDRNGTWYTGLHDGRLVKIRGDGQPKVVHVTEMPDFSGGRRKMRRPLGLRLHNTKLYVVDGYQGLFSVDVVDWKWEKIVAYDDVTPAMFFPDDLTISSDGETIYFTDASTRWAYEDAVFSIVEGECSGRVFKVELPTKRLTEVRAGLCFPNGIQLNNDETHLLVSENARKRVSVIDKLTGRTVKQVHLHGGPDNIRPARSGGYWIAVPSLPDPMGDYTNNYPFVRDILVKLLGRDGLTNFVSLNHGTVIKLNEKYEVISVHLDRHGKVCKAITEVQELESGELLLGTFLSQGIISVRGFMKNDQESNAA